MGISDDIAPRRGSSHHKTQPVIVKDDRIDEEKDSIHIFHESGHFDVAKPSKQELHDSFFETTAGDKEKAEEEKPKKSESSKEDTQSKHKKRDWIKIILNAWTLLGLLLVILVTLILQNFSYIKELFVGTKTEPKSKTETTANTERIVPQDYTATNSATPDTNTPAVTNPVTTTPTTTLDKSSLKIKLLNGNGITGSAEKIKSTLTQNGFTVSFIGNAKKFTYSTTYVYFKTGQDAGAESVKSALAGKNVTVTNDDTICTTYDIVIVIGKS